MRKFYWAFLSLMRIQDEWEGGDGLYQLDIVTDHDLQLLNPSEFFWLGDFNTANKIVNKALRREMLTQESKTINHIREECPGLKMVINETQAIYMRGLAHLEESEYLKRLKKDIVTAAAMYRNVDISAALD